MTSHIVEQKPENLVYAKPALMTDNTMRSQWESKALPPAPPTRAKNIY